VLESARGMDVFVVQSTCAPVNDNLMELLIMLDAFRRASARRITAVIPYYGYARQDKKIKPREPISARLVADLITVAGATRVVTIDLHAEQIQGFFDIPVDHLYAGPIIAEYLVREGYRDQNIVVVSPDVAGVPRVRAVAGALGGPLALIAQRRPAPDKGEVIGNFGRVPGRIGLLVDGEVDTGGSVVQGAEALLRRGAERIIAACTHPVFSGNAPQRLAESPIEKVICTDTIPVPPHKQFDKLVRLSVAPLLGEAISRIHRDESVSELFQNYR